MGVEGVYPSLWKVRVGSGPGKLKNSISHSMVIWLLETDAMLKDDLIFQSCWHVKNLEIIKIPVQNDQYIYLGYSLPPPRIGLTFFIC